MLECKSCPVRPFLCPEPFVSVAPRKTLQLLTKAAALSDLARGTCFSPSCLPLRLAFFFFDPIQSSCLPQDLCTRCFLEHISSTCKHGCLRVVIQGLAQMPPPGATLSNETAPPKSLSSLILSGMSFIVWAVTGYYLICLLACLYFPRFIMLFRPGI